MVNLSQTGPNIRMNTIWRLSVEIVDIYKGVCHLYVHYCNTHNVVEDNICIIYVVTPVVPMAVTHVYMYQILKLFHETNLKHAWIWTRCIFNWFFFITLIFAVALATSRKATIKMQIVNIGLTRITNSNFSVKSFYLRWSWVEVLDLYVVCIHSDSLMKWHIHPEQWSVLGGCEGNTNMAMIKE